MKRGIVHAASVLFAVAVLGSGAYAAEKQLVLVKTQEVKFSPYTPSLSLTGVIAARNSNNMSFRVGGRVAERKVEIGQHVTPDTVLASIDPQEQESDLRSADANLYAAQAQLRQAQATFDRQKTLFSRGYTTRRDYDDAEQALRVSQSSVESAQSQQADAKDKLSYTELRAGVSGIITARSVEAGQVVQAAQTVFTIAEDGDRDAVFNVDETLVAGNKAAPKVTISLLANSDITAQGEVREVSPVVDPASGSVRVKVGIPETPPEMPLGAAITGTISIDRGEAVVLPWQALSSTGGKPAVWTVDPATGIVAVQPIDVLSYDSGVVVINGGLEAGAHVVTAGTQLLRPGQTVEIASETSAENAR